MNGMVKMTWPDQDEEPGAAEIAKAAIGEQQRQRDGKSGNRQRQRDDLLDDARQPPSPHMQRVGRGNTDGQRHGKGREGDHERQQDGAGIELPDLRHPLQGHAGLDAAKIIHGDAGGNRQDRRHHQECGNDQGEDELAGEDQAIAHGLIRPRRRRCR